MDYKNIHAFTIIGETGSFKEAIQTLGVSASQLSKNMDRLETNLGRKLFDTQGRRLVLNNEGRRFLPAAKEIVKLQEEYMERVRNIAQSGKEQLSIALPAMSQAYGITTDIYLFQEQHPEIAVNIIQENRDITLEYLLDIGRVDLIFTTNKSCVQDTRRESSLYFRDYFKIVLPKSFPTHGKNSMSVAELKDERFLLMPENTMQYREVVKACGQNGFIPMINGYFVQADMIMNLVRMGKGVSVLMDKAMYRYTNYPSVKIIDPEPKMPIDIYIAWNRNTENRRVIRLFARFIEKRMNEAESAEKEDIDEDRVSE